MSEDVGKMISQDLKKRILDFLFDVDLHVMNEELRNEAIILIVAIYREERLNGWPTTI